MADAEARKPWYYDYPSQRDRVAELKAQVIGRCEELGVDYRITLYQFSQDLTARAVHESNWQEGIELELGKTRELNDLAFADFREATKAHLDSVKLLEIHKKRVVALKRKKAKFEELAALNLAAAYQVLNWIGWELSAAYTAALVKLVKQIVPVVKDIASKPDAKPLDPAALVSIEKGLVAADELQNEETSVFFPVTNGVSTQSQLLANLMEQDVDKLLHPMESEHIHLLHRILFMGLFPTNQCGAFRKKPVNVGSLTLFFPPPNVVPGMMKEYCSSFPCICPMAVKYDVILAAAKASHKFVAIHPYRDGNGRISRLLMNLVLWGHHPPVFLKADKKGRARYYYALRRADRGHPEALACLIARSLCSIYESLLTSLTTTKPAAKGA